MRTTWSLEKDDKKCVKYWLLWMKSSLGNLNMLDQLVGFSIKCAGLGQISMSLLYVKVIQEFSNQQQHSKLVIKCLNFPNFDYVYPCLRCLFFRIIYSHLLYHFEQMKLQLLKASILKEKQIKSCSKAEKIRWYTHTIPKLIVTESFYS